MNIFQGKIKLIIGIVVCIIAAVLVSGCTGPDTSTDNHNKVVKNVDGENIYEEPGVCPHCGSTHNRAEGSTPYLIGWKCEDCGRQYQSINSVDGVYTAP